MSTTIHQLNVGRDRPLAWLAGRRQAGDAPMFPLSVARIGPVGAADLSHAVIVGLFV
ncbi:hypothetical protein [Rhodococcus jostii]|uniref:hypothetical protein n=1 Tax=Rhodococcus jostii TaxID=132919 RepID=UPI0036292E4E